MKKIDLFERAIAEQAASLKDYGINSTAFWAYRRSIEAENELIDFSDTIWEADIDPIVQTLADNGITEFTISCTSTGLIKTLVEFEKRGFKVAGLAETNSPYTRLNGDRERIPAIRMERRVNF